MTTGQRIKQARTNMKMSQRQLAKAIGVSIPMIGQYESDLRKPKFERLLDIANALDVPVTALMERSAADAYQAGIDLGSSMEELQQILIDNLWKSEGYSHSNNEIKLINSFSQLTDEGQQQAIKYTEFLATDPRYQAPITASEDSPEEDILY